MDRIVAVVLAVRKLGSRKFVLRKRASPYVVEYAFAGLDIKYWILE